MKGIGTIKLKEALASLFVL